MPNESKEEKGAKEEKKQVVFPEIPWQAWFEAERHTIETSKQNPLLKDDQVAINSYSALLHYGHKDYMSKREAILLAKTILKELSSEEGK